MTRSALRRTVASFLFLLLSLAALATAAPARSAAGPKAEHSKGPTLVSSLWSTLIHFWEKAGGSLDPSGNPQPGVTPNSGSSLDPSGALSDNGSSLDPNGVK